MGVQSKKRKTAKVEEINFDSAARQEFLTGFHKRKVARARHAQEIAEKKAQEIKRQERNKVSPLLFCFFFFCFFLLQNQTDPNVSYRSGTNDRPSSSVF